ncbi:FecR family protein [Chitinophaga niastensis]|uniref:FecR family protein n=1 Tax=Chitinophaga niastensis TaxID=536980 RepID=A0A2P8HKE6_CHINA|nr:FecR domain-containing protein [Chitinophaga niastensis]PSL46640.1 FecR family protein [Chitinophaga niastensis]
MTKRLWELLALHWSGDISKEEQAELDELLLQHPSDWLKSGLLEQLSYRKISVIGEEETDNLMAKVNNAILEEENTWQQTGEQEVKPRFPLRKLLLSLLLLISCGSAFLAYRYWEQQHSGYKVVTTDAGMKTRIRLPDGSTIWLNAGSTLRYPEKMDQPQREVYLSGEGYFDIKQAASKPFIIHAEKMDIRVLGTAFNVRSYKDEDFVETSVINGAVEVSVKNEHAVSRLTLTHNQKVILRKKIIDKTENKNITSQTDEKEDMLIERQSLSPISSQDSSNVPETAWMSNQLIFRNETLRSLSQRLERWYGIKIIIQNPQLAKLRFSGRADNVSMEKLLNILQEIQPFNYSIQDGTVTIQ